jgi:hypothetical protein
MKIFPKILTLYSEDYKRQRYGKAFVWMLLISLIFLVSIAVIAQIEFQQVLYKKGQVISADSQVKEIVFDISPLWVTKVRAGNSVVLIDNDLNTVNATISNVERESVESIQLIGHIDCDDCQLILSQWVVLHIVTDETSMFDMFMETFHKE